MSGGRYRNSFLLLVVVGALLSAASWPTARHELRSSFTHEEGGYTVLAFTTPAPLEVGERGAYTDEYVVTNHRPTTRTVELEQLSTIDGHLTSSRFRLRMAANDTFVRQVTVGSSGSSYDVTVEVVGTDVSIHIFGRLER